MRHLQNFTSIIPMHSPPLLLTGDESYDTKTYEELLLRAAETLLGPVGWPAARLQSWLATP